MTTLPSSTYTRHVARYIIGPTKRHHYRSVDDLATREQSQAQQDRDTFKRHRCAEEGIKLYTGTIFDLSFERLYGFYVGLHHLMPIKSLPMSKMLFERMPEVQAVIAEADRLSRRRVRPHGAKRRSYREPGRIPLLQRLLRG
jgi:hypothetical protein